MIPHGKGKIAAIILARMKEKDSSKSDSYGDAEGSKPSVDPGMESAMEDFASALSNKDFAGMAQALCEFIHCHENSEEASEENED